MSEGHSTLDRLPEREERLQRIKDERQRKGEQEHREHALDSKRNQRAASGTLQNGLDAIGEHNEDAGGGDLIEPGESGADRRSYSSNGEGPNGRYQGDSSTRGTLATNERETPEKSPVKPRGLVAQASAKEHNERKLTEEEQAKKSAISAKKSQIMRDWWARRKAEGESEKGTEKTIRGVGNRPLSQAEMDAIRPELIKVIMDYSVLIDEGIRGTSKTKAICHIWEMDEEEASAIAYVLLMQARKNVGAATRVRQLLDSFAYVKTGAVLLPRFGATVKFYAENGIGILPTRRGKNGGG